MTKVVYTKWLFFADGFTVGPNLILINAECKDDKALVEHEKVHVQQMKRDGVWRMRWNYITSKRQRMIYEIEAYKESVKHDSRPEWYARYLVDDYGFDISYEQAVKILQT